MSATRRSDGLIVPSLILVSLCLHAAAGLQWRMIPVEVDGVKDTVVADFALGSDGIPWVLLSQPQSTICFWQDGQWHKLARESPMPYRFFGLHVSPGGQVYLAEPATDGEQRGRSMMWKPHFGALYLLKDEHAERVTEYYFYCNRFILSRRDAGAAGTDPCEHASGRSSLVRCGRARC